MAIAEGFPGQRMRVLAAPRVRQALAEPPTSLLTVTDAGYFPHASGHGRQRASGAAEAIVIVCVAGAGRLDVGRATWRVDAGQVAVIAPQVPHRYAAVAGDPWTIWWLHVIGETVPTWLAALQVDDATVLEVDDLAGCVAAVRGAVDALSGAGDDADLILAAQHGWTLLTVLGRQQRGQARPGDPVDVVTSLLTEHPEQRWTVTELASKVNVSPSHLGALFRAVTGGGVLAYQQRVRLARARELLSLTELTVTEVAHRVGYPDALYFSRVFRREHGVSPSSYRRDAREQAWPSGEPTDPREVR